MKQIKRLSVAVLALLLGFSAVAMAASNNFNDAQKQQIEKIVHDYLLKNPEVLVEVSQALQQKEQQQMMQRAEQAIPNYAKQLFSSSQSPAIGNKNATATLVEFFDYQCVHCRRMVPVVDNLLKADKNLRVVYKEFPIFGASSEYAAKAALAAQKQGKYQTFHDALMKAKTPLTSDKVMATAKQAGLNVEKLKKDMQSPEIAAELKQNSRLAQALGVVGTPAFVVAPYPYKTGAKPYFVPGGVSQDVLQGYISKASSAK